MHTAYASMCMGMCKARHRQPLHAASDNILTPTWCSWSQQQLQQPPVLPKPNVKPCSWNTTLRCSIDAAWGIDLACPPAGYVGEFAATSHTMPLTPALFHFFGRVLLSSLHYNLLLPAAVSAHKRGAEQRTRAQWGILGPPLVTLERYELM